MALGLPTCEPVMGSQPNIYYYDMLFTGPEIAPLDQVSFGLSAPGELSAPWSTPTEGAQPLELAPQQLEWQLAPSNSLSTNQGCEGALRRASHAQPEDAPQISRRSSSSGEAVAVHAEVIKEARKQQLLQEKNRCGNKDQRPGLSCLVLRRPNRPHVQDIV